MDLNWGESVAASEAWIGSLDGVLLVLDTYTATHVVVKRRAVFSGRPVVPINRLKRCDREGLYFNISISDALNLATLRNLEGEQFIVVLTPRTQVLCSDGKRLRLNGLRLSREDNSITHLISGKRTGSGRVLLAIDNVTGISTARISLSIGSGELGALPAYRRDRDIENDLWEVLYASDEIIDADLKGVQAHVVDSVIILQGNVRNPIAAAETERLARTVKGVVGVKNELANDRDVELAVATYVAKEARELLDGIFIHSQLGTITLSGYASSEEVKSELVHGIPSIAGVRGVEDGVQVRDPVQPITEEVAVGESEDDERATPVEEATAQQDEPG